MDLREVLLRPIGRLEEQRFGELMQEHHYLGRLPKISESLWYIALRRDQWVALLSFSAAAWKCAARDQWIGWSSHFQYARLELVVNNSRFLILPDCHIPNLGSRILSLCQKRPASDWQDSFGHPVVLIETFVDPPSSILSPLSMAGLKAEKSGSLPSSTITSTFPMLDKHSSSNAIARRRRPANLLVRPPMGSPVVHLNRSTHKTFSPPIGHTGALRTAATTSLTGTTMRIAAGFELDTGRKTSPGLDDLPSESSSPRAYPAWHRRCASSLEVSAPFSTTSE